MLILHFSKSVLTLNTELDPFTHPSHSSSNHSSPHPVCLGCLLPDNDALNRPEIDPPVQTSSGGFISACPGLLSLSLSFCLFLSFFVSRSITALGLRQPGLGSLDFKHSRRTRDKVRKQRVSESREEREERWRQSRKAGTWRGHV